MSKYTSEAFDLTGRVAVITGGSRGLGREMVLAFARAGADVVIASRKLAACEAVAEEVRALGRRALPCACHVGQWDALDVAFFFVHATFALHSCQTGNAQ